MKTNLNVRRVARAVALALLTPLAAGAAGGDFNGDGFDDLAIGVPDESIGAIAGAGAVNVLPGSATGLTALGDQIWSQDSGGVLDTAEVDDRFGDALAAGDFDGDGYDDLAIGAHFEDTTALLVNDGTVNVLFGSAAGLTSIASEIWNQDVLGVLDFAEDGDQFGASLAAGDFDGDGYDDLAVGVPGEDVGAIADAGAVQVLMGSAAGLTDLGNQLWTQASAGVPDAAELNDAFGSTLAAGDFNADGYDDLAIGTHYESVGALATAGTVHVLLGSAAGLTAAGSQQWTQDSPGIAGVAEQDDHFGRALATGDFDQDGYDDLAIGVPREDRAAGVNVGAINVIFGSAAGLTSAGDQLIYQDTPGILEAAEPDDQFGHALAAADVDGDGYDDLAIGVVGEDIGALVSAGAIHLILGSAGGLTDLGNQVWDQDSPGVLGLAETGDQFGDALAVGDFDQDGFADVAIGVFGEDRGGNFDAGTVNVLPGSAAGLTAVGDQRWDQNSPGVLGGVEGGDHFGSF